LFDLQLETSKIFIDFHKFSLFIIFFIFFRHSPHAPIGNNAGKQIKKEIDRRLDVINKLYYEPQLLDNSDKFIPNKLPNYYFRMKAVDDLKLLEKEIPTTRGQQPIRSFLLNYLTNSSQKLIHQYCDSYEHARFGIDDYGDAEYQKYHHLLLKMIEA
jgi:hypothetical protein